MMNNTTATPFPSCANVSGMSQCGVYGPRGPMPPEIQELLDLHHDLSPVFSACSFTFLSIALIGNFLVIMTIIKDPRIHGMAHVFLLNIAVADILYALVNFTGETLGYVLSREQNQATKCSVFRPLMALRFTSYAAAVFSLAALSVERWYAICKPFASARNATYKKKLKFVVIIMIWILSFVVSSPIALCTTGHEKIAAVVLAVSLLAFPFLVILTANVKIILSIRKAGMFVVGSNLGQEARRKRLLKLLFAIIISFFILWVPYTVLYLYQTFVRIPRTEIVRKLRVALVSRPIIVTSYIHPALNAVLYYGFCKDFRRGLVTLVRKSTRSTQST